MDKLDIILEKIECMDERMSAMDDKISAMDDKINVMDDKINVMDNDIKSIKLTLENEVRRDIMRVAEGHLDLSRNLKEAIKSNNEFEMLTIRVNVLETDVAELKQRIS